MHQDWLLYRSLKSPNKTFIEKGNYNYSFKAVNDIVYDRACSLINYGVSSNSKIAILLSDPLDFIEAYFACYKIGGVSLLLNHHSKNNEIKDIIENNTVDYIVCSWKDKGLFNGCKIPIIFFEELSKNHGSCFNDKINFEHLKDDIQSILFTSGTEGKPKSVCLTYNNFYESSIKWKDAIKLNSDDIYMLNLPLYHISGLAIIMRSIHIGFSVKIDTGLQHEQYNSTIISAVPTLINKLINDKHAANQLQLLRCIILSGSKISKDLLRSCKKLNLNIFLSYGMTETCSSICGFWPFKNDKYSGSVGTPFKGVKLGIKNNKICIESSTIMKCYLNHSENQGVIHTNDLGKIKDGYLYIDGRSDKLIVSGGENVDPSEAIKILKSKYNFDRIESFKEEDSYWGEISVIYIYTNMNITVDDILQELKSTLSNHKIPKKIFIKNTV